MAQRTLCGHCPFSIPFSLSISIFLSQKNSILIFQWLFVSLSLYTKYRPKTMDEKRNVRTPFIISFTIFHATFVLPAYSVSLFVSPMSAHLFRLITIEKCYKQFFSSFLLTVETFSFIFLASWLYAMRLWLGIWHQSDVNSPQEIDFNNSITTNNNSKHDKIVWWDNPAKWVTENGNSVALLFFAATTTTITDTHFRYDKQKPAETEATRAQQPTDKRKFVYFFFCRVFHCLVAHIHRQNLRLLSIFLCCVSALFLMLCVTQ